MLELIVAILISLGANFGYNDQGQVVIDQSTMNKLESTEQYQEIGSHGESVVVTNDVDPANSEIGNE